MLGCTPAVNLFAQPAEPIALDGTQSEWLVIPDARRPTALEVYSVEAVRLSRPDDPQPRKRAAFPAPAARRGTEADASDMSWLASRRLAPAGAGRHRNPADAARSASSIPRLPGRWRAEPRHAVLQPRPAFAAALRWRAAASAHHRSDRARRIGRMSLAAHSDPAAATARTERLAAGLASRSQPSRRDGWNAGRPRLARDAAAP